MRSSASRSIPSDGAWSYVGTDCRDIPLNEPTMNLGFLDGGTAAHEFGHAIGLAHEHQNPAGGIQWNEEVVDRRNGQVPQFLGRAEDPPQHPAQVHSESDQRHGLRPPLDHALLLSRLLDPEWHRHRRERGALGPGQAVRRRREDVSQDRRHGLHATELEVNAKTRTKASIGKLGEEDLFRFTAASDGRYVIDTRGPTDVVMKLFGPNSQTALIAEDDDSGYATNARIAAKLIAGDYFVQVRHYNRASGMGNYSIKVAKE